MKTTEDRIRDLFREHLNPDREPDFDVGVDESGVSSVQAVEFFKKVSEAFNLTIPPEDFAKLRNLRDLVGYLEVHGG